MNPLENLREALVNDPEFFPKSSDDVVPKERNVHDGEENEWINEKIDDSSSPVRYEPILRQKLYPPRKFSTTTEKTCDTCGAVIRGNNMYNHRKTKLHQAYEQMNQQLKRLVLNIPQNV
eukprot:Lithocolla_globosa_v1_NODE_2624_length_1929_cov_217.895411.p3 type:complete len:119 gc:universal NODE_2624_length_1929_cov_217.895411:623-267(-)